MSEFQIDWIKKHLSSEPQVILDVGTFDGADALRLKAAYPAARVIAFEACPDAYANIKKIGGVEKAGVEVFHLAVSNQDGEMDFYSNTDKRGWNKSGGCSGSLLKSTEHNFAKYDFLEYKPGRKVRTTRLDSFCAANGITDIDVMHMDVQGAEGYAIEGLGAMRPKLLFFEIDATDEYQGAVPLAVLFGQLKAWGYEKVWRGPNDAMFVFRGVNVMDSLTVCVTNFRRPKYLDRALASCRAAGIRRITISAVEADDATEAIIKKHADGWTSYDVRRVPDDCGCNNSWLIAVYASRTQRVLVLHDDDVLSPNLGKAYQEIIAPAMDAGAGFASWRPNILYDNGKTEACEYRKSPTGVYPSKELEPVIAACLTHSPVISVFDRETVIHACKEAEQTLTENGSLQRQGMLLGTELLVYIRHMQKFPKWCYVDQVLSSFGSHPGSGTIAEMNSGEAAVKALVVGYNLAREQGKRPAPAPKPRILLVYSMAYQPGEDEALRIALAHESWKFHFSNADVIELPVPESDFSRSGADIGDKTLPFVRDLFDIGCLRAMPEDIVVYTNTDIGFTSHAAERIIAGVARGRGVTVCPRRMLYPKAYRLYKSVLNCKYDGGFDVMAVTPRWWADNREKMPDMLIGREAWDTVFRTIAEEWADGVDRKSHVSSTAEEWARSNAYTDDVCWHYPHESAWCAGRTTLPGQIYNRKMARAFFVNRGNMGVVELIDSYEPGGIRAPKRPDPVVRARPELRSPAPPPPPPRNPGKPPGQPRPNHRRFIVGGPPKTFLRK